MATLLFSSLLLFAGEVSEADIHKLIKDLSSPEYSVREEARKKLIETGQPVVKHLQGLTDSDDVELAESAREIIEAINGKSGVKSTSKKRHGQRLFLTSTIRSPRSYSSSLTVAAGGETITVTVEGTSIDVRVMNTKTRKTTIYTAPGGVEGFKKKYPDIYKKYHKYIDDASRGSFVIDVQSFSKLKPRIERLPALPTWRDKRFGRDGEDMPDLWSRLFDLDDPLFTFPDREFDDYVRTLRRYMDALRKQLRGRRVEAPGLELEPIPIMPERTTMMVRKQANLGVKIETIGEDEARRLGIGAGSVWVCGAPEKGSVLAGAGIQKSDIIVKAGGKEFTSTFDARKKIMELLDGGGELEIMRDGRPKTIKIENY